MKSRSPATVFTLCLCISLFIAGIVEAQIPGSNEYRVKAAYLYNFAKFVEWPNDLFASPTSPIILGILGDDPFADALDSIRNKAIGSRRFEIKKIRSIDELRPCHLLFISTSESNRLSTILASLKQSRILTIGDVDGFTQKGGIINLVLVNNTVGFEINIDAANRAGLRINSRLLGIATVVHDSR